MFFLVDDREAATARKLRINIFPIKKTPPVAIKGMFFW
jgi:hypothetical protein